MKTSLSIISLVALSALAGCGDDDDNTPGGGEAGETSGGSGGSGTAGTGTEPIAGAPEGGTDTGGTAGTSAGGSTATGGTAGTAGTSAVGGAGGEGGASEPQPYYACQGTDQQFVRRAIQGVLGRHPYGQAEVNLYTDLLAEVDALDGVDPEELPAQPGKPLRHGRKVVMQALFQNPEYLANWDELYRDIMRVQRVDVYSNTACYSARTRPDADAVAKFIRDNPAETLAGDGGTPPTMADVIAGSLMLDDVTPMYTANLFGMLVKTYDGANGTPIESEVGRRQDFGAWFDGAYLNRDPVCLTCHNSEFSVTQSADPATNRHFPIPALLEKALLGYSTGAPVSGSFDAGDIMHANLKFARFVSTCNNPPSQAVFDAAVAAGTITPDMCPPGPANAPLSNYRVCTTASSLGPRDIVCLSTVQQSRSARPWNIAQGCGQFMDPSAVPADLAGVNGRFASTSGLRSTAWDTARALRNGFEKLRTEGLGADPVTWEVSDPDKAFAYMTSMTIVEKVWKEITGTGLTITTYFPRNAAARDQLQHLTDTFIASGYSHKALLEEIFASPYLNLAPPDSECWENAYALPRIFDPWVTGDADPVRRNNSVGDGALMLSARTAARSSYGALGWRLSAWGSSFPNQSGSIENSLTITPAVPGGAAAVTTGPLERQFQNETGYFNKTTDLGFRGFDFQARLGFEDRFGQCKKLFPYQNRPDAINDVLAKAKTLDGATVKDALDVLKDRLFGTTLYTPAEQAAIEKLMGTTFDASIDTLSEPAYRKVCGAMVTAPQNLMSLVAVVAPDATEVPKLTPAGSTYERSCLVLSEATLPDGLKVTCNGNEPITVDVVEPTASL
ncbi:MAG: hypothetical protein K0R38_387 [Polyangiaceae bacterium]|jgi:hypothetical protein|nr:hypothetical protein [Polyangiaceae bacterium]